MSSFIIKKCSICDGEYGEKVRKPLVLSCGHTFCDECLTLMSKSGSRNCAICRKYWGSRNVDHLPLCYQLLPEDIPGVSNLCTAHNAQTLFWCLSCDCKLCRKCLCDKHKKCEWLLIEEKIDHLREYFDKTIGSLTDELVSFNSKLKTTTCQNKALIDLVSAMMKNLETILTEVSGHQQQMLLLKTKIAKAMPLLLDMKKDWNIQPGSDIIGHLTEKNKKLNSIKSLAVWPPQPDISPLEKFLQNANRNKHGTGLLDICSGICLNSSLYVNIEDEDIIDTSCLYKISDDAEPDIKRSRETEQQNSDVDDVPSTSEVQVQPSNGDGEHLEENQSNIAENNPVEHLIAQDTQTASTESVQTADSNVNSIMPTIVCELVGDSSPRTVTTSENDENSEVSAITTSREMETSSVEASPSGSTIQLPNVEVSGIASDSDSDVLEVPRSVGSQTPPMEEPLPGQSETVASEVNTAGETQDILVENSTVDNPSCTIEIPSTQHRAEVQVVTSDNSVQETAITASNYNESSQTTSDIETSGDIGARINSPTTESQNQSTGNTQESVYRDSTEESNANIDVQHVTTSTMEPANLSQNETVVSESVAVDNSIASTSSSPNSNIHQATASTSESETPGMENPQERSVRPKTRKPILGFTEFVSNMFGGHSNEAWNFQHSTGFQGFGGQTPRRVFLRRGGPFLRRTVPEVRMEEVSISYSHL